MNARPEPAGDAYGAELIGALNRDVFDLEDYDAETAANAAAKEIPQLGKFVRQHFLVTGETREGKTSATDLYAAAATPTILDFTDLARRIIETENRALDCGDSIDAVKVRRRRMVARLHNALDRVAEQSRTGVEKAAGVPAWTCPDCHTVHVDAPTSVLTGEQYCPPCLRRQP